jgi:GcrA cell cycle regulator
VTDSSVSRKAFKERCLALHGKGSSTDAARILRDEFNINISRDTVRNLWARAGLFGSTSTHTQAVAAAVQTLKARAIELHKSGTATEVAEVLSKEFGKTVSRNAVIGHWHRAGLSVPVVAAKAPDGSPLWKKRQRDRVRRMESEVLKPAEKEKRAKPKTQSQVKEVAAPIASVTTKLASDAPPLVDAGESGASPRSALPGPYAVSFFEIKGAKCRWPHGNPRDLDTFRFCGAITPADRSYCTAHAGIAYAPPAPRTTARQKAHALSNQAIRLAAMEAAT